MITVGRSIKFYSFPFQDHEVKNWKMSDTTSSKNWPTVYLILKLYRRYPHTC